jgi:hypothetical protein
MAEVMTMTLMLGEAGDLLHKHDGIQKSIRINFDDNVPEAECALFIACSLLRDSLNEEGIDVERSKKIINELDIFSSFDVEQQRSVKRSIADGSFDKDYFLGRCMWLLMWGQDMLLAERIRTYQFGFLKDEIYNGLLGKAPKDLQIERIQGKNGR